MRGRGRLAAVVAALSLAAACSGEPGTPAASSAHARDVPGRAAPATSTPAPTPTGPPTVTIGWSGDAVPASVDAGLPPDPARLFGAITPYVRAPDVMIGNLEGTLTDVAGSSKCGPGSTDCVAFRAPPGVRGGCSPRAGYDVLSLAQHPRARPRRGRPGPDPPGRPGRRDAHHRRPGRDRGHHRPRRCGSPWSASLPYGWAVPLNDPAAVRSLRQPCRRPRGHRDRRLPRRRRGQRRAARAGWPASSRSARTAATCARSPGPRWPPALTPCSVPARTSSAGPRSSPAARWRTRWATWSATACCPPPGVLDTQPRSIQARLPGGRRQPGSAGCSGRRSRQRAARLARSPIRDRRR